MPSEAQFKRLWAITHSNKNKWTEEKVKTYMLHAWGIDSKINLNRTQYKTLTDDIIEKMSFETAMESIEPSY